MALSTSVLWRRLDAPGHDAATLAEGTAGAELRGTATFKGERGPTALHYHVRCDAGWQTTQAYLHGWHGTEAVEFRIARDEVGQWRCNGGKCPAIAGCLDLDLSFTPATNLLPVRRLNLAVGDTAEVRSAWLEWPAGILSPLVQRYHRRSAFVYQYEADLPSGDEFTAALRVNSSGWVLDYAGLWQVEAAAP